MAHTPQALVFSASKVSAHPASRDVDDDALDRAAAKLRPVWAEPEVSTDPELEPAAPPPLPPEALASSSRFAAGRESVPSLHALATAPTRTREPVASANPELFIPDVSINTFASATRRAARARPFSGRGRLRLGRLLAGRWQRIALLSLAAVLAAWAVAAQLTDSPTASTTPAAQPAARPSPKAAAPAIPAPTAAPPAEPIERAAGSLQAKPRKGGETKRASQLGARAAKKSSKAERTRAARVGPAARTQASDKRTKQPAATKASGVRAKPRVSDKRDTKAR